MFLNKRYFASDVAFSSYIYIYIYMFLKFVKVLLLTHIIENMDDIVRKCVPPWPPGDSLLSDTMH